MGALTRPKRFGLAISAAVLAVGIATQTANAAVIVFPVRYWGEVCARPLNSSLISQFRLDLQQSPWAPARQYASLPDSQLKLVIQRGCNAFRQYGTAERANAAAFGG
ncbi:hypothetical protein Pth03_59120 [Planotetraspora thailandica]|uniref:Uncharacterized protein n=1 Tax=Planotetraspora thailandica TaxID=487172 RepID=A0A8J3V518_9ACTN|nr:hypothetical protein Pth03_59120 [Planotetraspora thailandica]